MTSATTAAPFKLSLGTKRSAPQTNGTAKSSSVFKDEADIDGDVDQGQQISTFDTSARSQKVEPPRVIRGIPNKDWREESRRKRQKSDIPRESQGQARGEVEQDVVTDEKPAYGLTFASRAEAQDATKGEVAEDAANHEGIADQRKAPPPPKTADEEAMDALLGNRPAAQNTIVAPTSPQNEDDAFRSDFRTAPPPTTAEQYEATPVEGFGAALLRGYLKPGETLESRIEGHANGLKASGKSKESVMKKRAGLLGIGAKESGLGVELGAWGRASRGGKGQSQAEPGYNPLVRKNRTTGEVISEEELKEKLEAQKEVALAPNSNKSDDKQRRQIADNDHRGDRRERSASRDKKDHRRQDRHQSSRHERRSSADRYQHRSKHYEDDDDYRDRKERERRRRERDLDDRYDSKRSSRRDDGRRETHSDRGERDRDRRR